MGPGYAAGSQLDDVVITAVAIAIAGHETTGNLFRAAMIRVMTSSCARRADLLPVAVEQDAGSSRGHERRSAAEAIRYLQ